jgi:hypothetical protein
MMMLEHVDTLAKTSADAISNIQFDKVTVWDTGAGLIDTHTRRIGNDPPLV